MLQAECTLFANKWGSFVQCLKIELVRTCSETFRAFHHQVNHFS